jgi:4-amino-4-deoxy-L-arabinose transferase-like glycosyltransferase
MLLNSESPERAVGHDYLSTLSGSSTLSADVHLTRAAARSPTLREGARQFLEPPDTEHYLAQVTCVIAVLMVVRIATAATTPLAFDEAYYWLWSKHLAGGYFDHPPMVAIIIRLGTLVAGDTELGVRLISTLLAGPATWAVWRTAQILFNNAKLAATAALFFNLSLIVSVGTVVVTPDAPLLVASAFVLLFLAKLIETERGVWWLAVGTAVGAGLLSKYTAWFFGLSILLWLMIVAEMRRWLRTCWPWLGGAIALLLFTPVLLWNASHHWNSFVYQYSRRIIVNEWTTRYLGEYLASQAGLATPCIFVLGSVGLAALFLGLGGNRSARVLVGAMVWPLAIYFTWHSLHQRVEGNWTSPIFPALSIAAAVAAHGVKWTESWATIVTWLNRLATPIGLGISAVIYAQAAFGIIPLGAIDPTARQLGAGWRQVATEIDSIRQRVGAHGVLTASYGMTGWLSFYLPSQPAVVQVNERFRWENEASPTADFFDGPLIYVCRFSVPEADIIQKRFKNVRDIATVARRRTGVVIERYSVYSVDSPVGDPLDNTSLHDVLKQQRERPELERQGHVQMPPVAARPVRFCENGG